jgi:hypothetical protein
MPKPDCPGEGFMASVGGGGALLKDIPPEQTVQGLLCVRSFAGDFFRSFSLH